jgi:hypothetical protein
MKGPNPKKCPKIMESSSKKINIKSFDEMSGGLGPKVGAIGKHIEENQYQKFR